MNHSRSNPPIHYCPTCGVRLKPGGSTQCSEAKHAASRKSQYHYCTDCGKDLKKG